MKENKIYLVLLIIAMMLCSVSTKAQMVDPVHASAQLKTDGSAVGEIVFSLKIDAGWHVYGANLGTDGPIQASFHGAKMVGVEPVGRLVSRGKEISKYDNMFGMQLRYFENSVQFVQKVKFVKPDYKIDAYLEYGACNDQSCMPPQQISIVKTGKSPSVDAKAVKEEPKKKAIKTEKAQETITDSTVSAALVPAVVRTDTSKIAVAGNLWNPVIKEMRTFDGTSTDSNGSLIYIFFMGFVGGLLALFTPCVWPIIPMTVSFFLKRSKNRAKGLRDAVTYGISIIVIFLMLGLLVTSIYDPHKLNELATSAVFNIVFFLMLVVFALSFFGWFELRLPASWGNKVDSKASATTGLLSIFLMALTLVLVSFSCTAPIVGLLLVEAATSGNLIGPAIGMFGFALALALPFTLFAIFPSWLKQVPKSGSWMNTIKIVLGFIELAFALKFLSVADLAYGWHILDREVFLSLWIVIFGLLGL